MSWTRFRCPPFIDIHPALADTHLWLPSSDLAVPGWPINQTASRPPDSTRKLHASAWVRNSGRAFRVHHPAEVRSRSANWRFPPGWLPLSSWLFHPWCSFFWVCCSNSRSCSSMMYCLVAGWILPLGFGGITTMRNTFKRWENGIPDTHARRPFIFHCLAPVGNFCCHNSCPPSFYLPLSL